MKKKFSALQQVVIDFLSDFSVDGDRTIQKNEPVSGNFALFRGATQPDLYGIVDAVYVLFTLGILAQQTTVKSRTVWAERILLCQESTGWFAKNNLRGHSREHATAYAIGALKLLGIDQSEKYLERAKPVSELTPLFTDNQVLLGWLENLDFSWNAKKILKKQLGWHYIWRGSHIGGGVPAILGMTQNHGNPQGPNAGTQWLERYFDWLDAHANPETGYWQRAFWNSVYRKPTIIDMGGAVHFFWIYEAAGRSFPFPEAVIKSTLKLQRPDGLYRDHPYCIDLDGNFCLIRSYLQLPPDRQEKYREHVYRAAEMNFEAIVRTLVEKPLREVYRDSHGLPGALAALVECTKLPDFKYSENLQTWRHPLDVVWWI